MGPWRARSNEQRRSDPGFGYAVRWPGLDARLRGRRVEGLRYEPDGGFVVVELWVSADLEGCQVLGVGDSPARAVGLVLRTQPLRWGWPMGQIFRLILRGGPPALAYICVG